ncbi:unnamed protein product [Nippostrongylus brasiliensis]|uniref:Uma2 domain-containing protein n=1 Tax=Nippostrongylus brasiliensis TaxID=27835 RepID=A0A158R079_NIPBR|nr:unnamed protein product [Nippostrongylus brasiliensis]
MSSIHFCFSGQERNILDLPRNAQLDEARYESVLGTDPGTQLPYMQGSVEITRQEFGVKMRKFLQAMGFSVSLVV